MYIYGSKYLKSLFFSILLFFSVITFSQPANPQNFSMEERNNITVYESVSPSIVGIDVDIDEGVSSGTGIVVGGSGLILTSSHVVEGSKGIKVTLPTGQSYDGHVIANENIDEGDFVLIKIDSSSKLPVIRLGDSSQLKVGQKVLAIGNPFGFNRSMTTGIISRVDTKRNKIQTDAAINPGSSGGPLLNVNGEVVGINQSIYNPDNNKSNIGIGFAIPVNEVKKFISDIRKTSPSLFYN